MTIALRQAPELADLELPSLAATIIEEHRQVEEAAGSMLGHAIAAGHALLEARRRIFKGARDGSWHEWLNENCPVVISAATNYMRIAHYADSLPSENMTISEARKYLRGLPTFAGKGHPNQGYPPFVKQQAKVLRKGGATYESIAETLDVSPGTVYRWLVPGFAERHRKQTARSRKVRDAALAAMRDKQKRETRIRAARAFGGVLGKAYSQLRLHIESLDQAHGEATDGVLRAHLREALGFAYKAEDAIAKALKVP